MSAQGPDDHQLKKIVLPSGKTIEVVYFDHASFAAPQSEPPREAPADRPADEERELHVCTNCASTLVYPVQWEEASPKSWHVTLRCPECEWLEGGVFSQNQCDRFDDELEAGTDALTRDYRRLVTANMSDEIDRFSAALRVDAILPSDF